MCAATSSLELLKEADSSVFDDTVDTLNRLLGLVDSVE